MKLSLDFSCDSDKYVLTVSIEHKNMCILRTHYQHIFINDKDIEIDELREKLRALCAHDTPLELFSDINVHYGSSLSLSFANGAFLCAYTSMPTREQELTTNSIYLLRSDEQQQFYRELRQLMEILSTHKRIRII